MKDSSNSFVMNIYVSDDPVTEYLANGNIFIEGRPGTKFSLEISNKLNEPVLMIPSIDGKSIIDQNDAGLDSPGIILGPRKYMKIDKWYDTKDSFVFGDAKKSYIGKGPRQSNVGAIGCLVFREGHEEIQPLTPQIIEQNAILSVSRSSYSIDAADLSEYINPSSAVPLELQSFYTRSINKAEKFIKRDPSYPDAVLSMYYDTAKGLEKKGIIISYRSSAPSAFPSYRNSSTPYTFSNLKGDD